MLAGAARGVVPEVSAPDSGRAGSGRAAASCWSRSPTSTAGRSWPRRSCPITCTCSCGSARPMRRRRWCGRSRAAPRGCCAQEFPHLRPREGVVVAVVFRRLGRLRLGVDGAPLHRAPVGRGGVVRRAYVFRLRPTARQHIALAACVDAHRELYNAALQERRDAWSHSKTRISYGDQSAQLTEIRSARPDQAVWSFSSPAGHAAPAQQGVRRVLPPGEGGPDSRAIRGSRARPGSTVWSGPKTVTAPAGCPSSGGCICKVSARSKSTCTARWRAG